MRTRKDATRHWIRAKGREKFTDTKDELAWDAFAAQFLIISAKPKGPIVFVAPDRSGKPRQWTVEPDRVAHLRATKPDTAKKFYVFVDGDPSHFTDRGRANDDWTCRELAERNMRSARIDSPLLTNPEHWPHVYAKLKEFDQGREPWTRLWQ